VGIAVGGWLGGTEPAAAKEDPWFSDPYAHPGRPGGPRSPSA